MVRIAELSYYLTQGFLYKNISMFLDRGDKIGLTGKNGVGKSTLLKLINGDITPTEGKVIREKNIRIGFLTQDIEIEKKFTARLILPSTRLQCRTGRSENAISQKSEIERG